MIYKEGYLEKESKLGPENVLTGVCENILLAENSAGFLFLQVEPEVAVNYVFVYLNGGSCVFFLWKDGEILSRKQQHILYIYLTVPQIFEVL